MNSLIGVWLYASLIYQGVPMNKPNPDLIMSISFISDTTNEIYYYRKNEAGFCKRTASYIVADGILRQEVIAVDENNASFCSQDTDMQLGNISNTPYEIKDQKLLLTLPLGEENLIFVWEKQIQ
jgi:hypothetical protein